jgi:hypothetical protein
MIALCAQLAAVRLMAVAACDAARVHLALQERAPDVDLVALLAVGVIERIGKQRRAIVIEKRFARRIAFENLAASRVALCARLDFSLGGTRTRSDRIAISAGSSPGHAAPFIEANRQSLSVMSSLIVFPL